MKVEGLKNEYVYFTHRPIFGMTVCLYNENNKLYVGSSIVYDGTNSELKPKKRPDQFSRKEGRKQSVSKLKARYNKPDGAVPLSCYFEFNKPIDSVAMKEFMHRFRKAWKPDPTEQDIGGDPLSKLEDNLRSDAWSVVCIFAKKVMEEVLA